jgi:long-chain acyl-CoA synthetase
VEEANASLPEARRVREFRLLPEALDEELTPTGKIKRAVLQERYAALIEEMYGGQSVAARSS